MIIKKSNNRYEVRSKNGKKLLGIHKTRLEALRQMQAIEASKHEKGNK